MKTGDNSASVNKNTDSTVKNSEQVQTAKEGKGLDREIVYFMHDALLTEKRFNSIQNSILIRLKLLAERVAVALIYSEPSSINFDEFKRERISEEVSAELKSLSEFEQNLLLCLLDRFDVLRTFKHPETFKDVKDEYIWIKNNFPSYINILKGLNKAQDSQIIEVAQDASATYNTDFPEDFVFCTEYTPLPAASEPIAQDTVSTQESESFDQNASLFRSLYSISEKSIEAIISMFFNGNASYISHQIQDLFFRVSALCNHADFEVKLLDFCFFFLYTPDYLDTCSTDQNTFPYTSLLGINAPNQSSYTYQVVAANILDFFRYLFPEREYLLYQPRLYLEQFGLKSLQDIKPKTQFRANTAGLISIADLLLGVYSIKQLSSIPAAKSQWGDFVDCLFSTPQERSRILAEPSIK